MATWAEAARRVPWRDVAEIGAMTAAFVLLGATAANAAFPIPVIPQMVSDTGQSVTNEGSMIAIILAVGGAGLATIRGDGEGAIGRFVKGGLGGGTMGAALPLATYW